MTPGTRTHGAEQSDETRALLSNPLHGLSEPRQLAAVLGVPLPELWRLSRAVNNYFAFETQTGGKLRLVTAPRRRLEKIQGDVCHQLRRLGQPDYLHSVMRGRSNVTHAAGHQGQAWLCKIDLRSFYLQVTAAHVRRFFSHDMQCSASVAALLTRLCTTEGHLPIGGKVSQQLAFRVAKPMLDELASLAMAANIRFSCNVDDLCFSGEKATPSFLWRVKQVIHRHGFRYHDAKCYRPGQPRLVTGVLLTDAGTTLRGRDVLRIRQELSARFNADPCEKKLRSLQGRLAAASAIDSRYRPALDAVQARLKTLSAHGPIRGAPRNMLVQST